METEIMREFRHQIEILLRDHTYLIDTEKKHPEIKGYELLQEYPGCNRSVGDFEPYTSGAFSKYPNIWKPVYHKEVERDRKIDQILGE